MYRSTWWDAWDVSVTVVSERGEERFILPLQVGEPGAQIQWVWIAAVMITHRGGGDLDLAHHAKAAGRVTMTRSARGWLISHGAFGAAGACAAAIVLPAEAHGFGERYDLPLPLSLFVIAGAAAVALSFVIAAVFLRGGCLRTRLTVRLNLLDFVATRWISDRPGSPAL